MTTEQLETYLASDSISMDMSVFKIDSLPNYGSVIDGAPFWIDMRTLYHNNDSTQFSYSGNLGGSDEYKDSNKHLLINTLNRETNLFKQIPFDYYFTPDRYLRIILRYMEGNEGLLEFIPYHLILEELFPKDE